MSVEEHVHYKTTKIHNANAILCLNFIDPKNVEFVFHYRPPPNVITSFLRLQERIVSIEYEQYATKWWKSRTTQNR